MFKDIRNRLYLLCMRKVLNEVVKVNRAFQAGSSGDVTKLLSDLLQLQLFLMQLVVVPSVLEKVPATSISSFAFRQHLMPTAAVHLGFEFESACGTSQLSTDELTHIQERGKNFIIELVEQVQLRLPANIEALLKC